MAIDPDVQSVLDPLEQRVSDLESQPAAASDASLRFQAALFPALLAATDRDALWDDLTAFLENRG